MSKPIVIFIPYDEEEDKEDGAWCVSVDGKTPREEYYVECKSRKSALELKNVVIEFLKIEKKLYKILRKSVFTNCDIEDDVWKLVRIHE